MGPYAGVDYNLTLCPLYRVDSNTFTMGNPVPESTLSLYARVHFIPQSGSSDLASAIATDV